MENTTQCPFCGDKIAYATFLETPNFRAIYNIAPILPGHSLVIPKRHIESFLDLSDEEVTEFIFLGRSAIKLLLKIFKTSAFNWTIQEKSEAGQTIAHLHLHLIPRKEKDLENPGDWYPLILKQENEGLIDSETRAKLSIEEVKTIVNKIKSFI